jgi:hypothetical protein
MMLIETLIQTVIDWIRDIFVELLGQRAANFVIERLKQKRRQKKRLRRRGPARRARLENKR